MHPKQRNKRKDIIFILGSSFIVVVTWIAFNIHHIWATSTVAENIQTQLTPIEPVFDYTVIKQLKKREQIDPLYDKPESTAQTPAITASVSAQASNAARFAPPTETINGIQGQ